MLTVIVIEIVIGLLLIAIGLGFVMNVLNVRFKFRDCDAVRGKGFPS